MATREQMESWMLDFSKLRKRQGWETTSEIPDHLFTRVLTILGEMRAIWNYNVSHNLEFIQQQKHIIHKRWEIQPAPLSSAYFSLPYQHHIFPFSMKFQLVL